MHDLKVTVLGSGTSQGVPVIGCQCKVCTSSNQHDKRLRSAILLTWNNQNFVIDTGPDFRQQMLREQVKSLRAILYTHEHKDHIAGMDDVRAFNYLERRDMQLFCTKAVENALRREFYYAFEAEKYPGVPNVNIQQITENRTFRMPDGPEVQPILVMHHKMPVLGFRFGDFAYVTDIKTISNQELEKLKGIKILILGCLRIKQHLSHLNLEEALALIDIIQPKETFLTHISHLFDTHENILKMLPKNVQPAYDGLNFVVKNVR